MRQPVREPEFVLGMCTIAMVSFLKRFLVLLLVLSIVAVAAISYIDERLQERCDRRWAVSRIVALVPDVESSWRLTLFGHYYRFNLNEIGQQIEEWVATGYEQLYSWLSERIKFGS